MKKPEQIPNQISQKSSEHQTDGIGTLFCPNDNERGQSLMLTHHIVSRVIGKVSTDETPEGGKTRFTKEIFVEPQQAQKSMRLTKPK